MGIIPSSACGTKLLLLLLRFGVTRASAIKHRVAVLKNYVDGFCAMEKFTGDIIRNSVIYELSPIVNTKSIMKGEMMKKVIMLVFLCVCALAQNDEAPKERSATILKSHNDHMFDSKSYTLVLIKLSPNKYVITVPSGRFESLRACGQFRLEGKIENLSSHRFFHMSVSNDENPKGDSDTLTIRAIGSKKKGTTQELRYNYMHLRNDKPKCQVRTNQLTEPFHRMCEINQFILESLKECSAQQVKVALEKSGMLDEIVVFAKTSFKRYVVQEEIID